MILTLSLAMLLWQGTFAQPKLDGRYGVDRVAFEQKAQQIRDEMNGKFSVDSVEVKTYSAQRRQNGKTQAVGSPLDCRLGDDLGGMCSEEQSESNPRNPVGAEYRLSTQ